MKDYLDKVVSAVQGVDLAEIGRAIDLLETAYHEDRSVFVIGNGGSASNASHFAQDLSKGSVPDLEGKRFRVVSLTDNISFITALANDIGYDRVFDLQLRQFAGEGDVLVAISGSGRSPNIIRAVQYAIRTGMKVLGMCGFDGGQLLQLSTVKIHVSISNMCQCEAVHSVLMHLIADELKERLKRKAK